MIRGGVLPPDVIETVRLRFEAEAQAWRGNSRSERYEVLERMAGALLLKAVAGDMLPIPSDGGNGAP